MTNGFIAYVLVWALMYVYCKNQKQSLIYGIIAGMVVLISNFFWFLTSGNGESWAKYNLGLRYNADEVNFFTMFFTFSPVIIILVFLYFAVKKARSLKSGLSNIKAGK